GRAFVELRRARSEADEARVRYESARTTFPSEFPRAPTDSTLPELDALAQRARSRVDGAAASVTQVEHELSELNELLEGGVCPRCHQPVDRAGFTDHRAELGQALARQQGALALERAEEERVRGLRKARENFERELAEHESSHHRQEALHEAATGGEARAARAEEAASAATLAKQRCEARVAEVTPRAALFDELSGKLGLAEAALERAEADRHRSELSIQKAEETAGRYRLLRAEAERLQEECRRLEERFAERRRRIDELEVSLRGLPELAKAAKERAEAHDRERRSLAALREELARSGAQRDEAVRNLEKARAGVERRAKLREEARHRRELAEWTGGAFREALLRLEHRLLAQAQVEFDRAFSRYFASLVEDPALVARSGAGFTPSVDLDGEPTPAEALSGGERTALALSFRLALGHVVRSAGRLRLETLLLDEPTDGFSPEQVQRMGELLKEVAIPQVILVSHEAGLAGFADRVVRVEKHDGVSKLLIGPDGDEEPSGPPGEREGNSGPTRRRPRRIQSGLNEPATPLP
ncbi:MAG: hypothetical protein L3K09_07805, partial [Thermoplasmata archaeon]|nr:hypothetical protein [Thermoplasmata archaeon]